MARGDYLNHVRDGGILDSRPERPAYEPVYRNEEQRTINYWQHTNTTGTRYIERMSMVWWNVFVGRAISLVAFWGIMAIGVIFVPSQYMDTYVDWAFSLVFLTLMAFIIGLLYRAFRRVYPATQFERDGY